MTISVQNLRKTYQVNIASKTLFAGFKQLIRPELRSVLAVDDISFSIQSGERVAFIGPNGAGKSTTIKILAGILQPDSGAVSVAGHVPWLERSELAYKIGTIFGQRSQLRMNLSALDTFELLRKIYRIDDARFRAQLERTIESFSLAPLLEKPVRTLSLGERMRCEMAASLLHQPQILFFDEPTIGLDVTAKAIIREIVRKLSVDFGVTLLFTSHDTVDIEQVCERVIVINHGRVVLDSKLSTIKSQFLQSKRITAVGNFATTNALSEGTAGDGPILVSDGLTLEESDNHQRVYRVDMKRTTVPRAIAEISSMGDIQDFTIEGPPLEEVIREIYHRGVNVSE